MKNASSEEICRRQAFARILLWQHFDFFNGIGQKPTFCRLSVTLLASRSAIGKSTLQQGTPQDQ
jgi:hypothetical protein